MPLPGTLLKRIQQVMLDAFSRDELRALVRFGLEQDFEALTPDKALTAQVFALTTWARRNGRLLDLLRCAHEERPGNQELQALWAELASRPLTDFAPLPADTNWRVPFLRNPQFVGRERDLDGLHAALQDGAAVGIRPVGLTGLGGIGKTQLAVEYCYRYREAYPGGVFWLNAAGAWLPAFADLGLFLDEELAGKALDRQARAAVDYFAAYPDSLLVLDNVADPALLRVPVTPDLTPAALPCRVLFTTRSRDLGDFQPVEVSVLPEEPGLRLLLRHPARQPALDPAHPEHGAAVDIYAMLGGLPLALEIAGAHLGKLAGKPMVAYRDELLRRGALAVIDDRRGGVRDVDLGTRHAAAVEATLAEQWATLAGDDARLLLRVAGRFPEAAVIPAARLGLLANLADHDDGFFGAPLALALDELHKAALVERLSGDTVRLHPLVRDFAARRTAPDVASAFCSECAANLFAAYRDFATLEEHCARRGVAALEADLLAALALAEHDPALQSPISHLLRMLQRESHTLRGWDATTQPDYFAGQWLKRALIEGDAAMQQQARHGAKAAPRLAMNWLTTRPSSALERMLTGHNHVVLAVTATPDGRRAISALGDGTLKVWNLATGAEERTLTGHGDSVNAVVVTPDGRQVISASSDRTLKVWDVATGTEERTLTGHGSGVRAVGVMPDGRWAISASDDGTLKVWDLATGTEQRTLTGHDSFVNAVVVTPDGRQAISASDDRTLKVWDLATGTEERTLTGHGSRVNAVAVTPDGRQVISASSDRTLKVWDLATGAEERTLTGHASGVFALAVTPDGRWVISASDDPTLKVWDLATGAEERTLTGHVDWVLAAAVTPDGRRVIWASGYRMLEVWDLAMGAEERTLTGHNSFVNAVVVTPDGRQAISASSDRTLKVWDLATGAEEHTLIGHGSAVLAVAVTPDGRQVISGSSDRTLKVWDLATGTAERTLTGRGGSVNAVVVTPDGRQVISASHDHTLKVWDLATGVEERTLTGHRGWVLAVVVMPDGCQVISASADRTLKVWNLATGAEERTLTGHGHSVNAVVVTPDGRRVISASHDGTLKVWNLATGAEERTLIGHGSRVSAVAMTPDGRRVISASHDGTLKMWDLATGQQLASIMLEAGFYCVAMAQDDVTIVAGDDMGNMYCLSFLEPGVAT